MSTTTSTPAGTTLGAAAPAEADERPYRTWMCVICGFIYDEAQGLPEEGIPPGTRWEDIPETWQCPDCQMGKADFEMVAV